jgi:glyoxylase-like metal-dependent hydrolase (beta-lactamase superfamily II)
MKSFLALFSLFFLSLSFLFAQGEPGQVTKVTDKLYFISGYGGNVAFLTTDEGVVVVDAGTMPSFGESIIEKIRKVTDKPIRYLIITHYHSDHTNGIQAFPSNITLIQHQNLLGNLQTRRTMRLKTLVEVELPVEIADMKKNIAKLKQQQSAELSIAEKELVSSEAELEAYKSIKIIEPTITFEKMYTFSIGGEKIVLVYPGPCHTTDNIFVVFETQHVLHTGDLLFNGSFPYIIWQDSTNTQTWALTLRKLSEEKKFDIVIPGHGARTITKGLLRLSEYLVDLNIAVEDAMKAGKSLDQMKKSLMMEKYADFSWPQLRVQNIESVYHELGGK